MQVRPDDEDAVSQAQLQEALIAGGPEDFHRVLTHLRALKHYEALQRLLRADPALITRVADITRHSYTFLLEVMGWLAYDQLAELRALRRHDPALAIYPDMESEFAKAAVDIFNPALTEEEQADAVAQCTKMARTDGVYFEVLALELAAADQVRLIELQKKGVFPDFVRYVDRLAVDLARDGDVSLMHRLYLAVLNDSMLQPLVSRAVLAPPTRTAIVLARGSASVAADLSSRSLFCLGSRDHTDVKDALIEDGGFLFRVGLLMYTAPIQEHIKHLQAQLDADLGQLDLQTPTYIEFLSVTLPKEAKVFIIQEYFFKSAKILKVMGSHGFGEGLRMLERRDRLAQVFGVAPADLCTTTEEVFHETVMRVILQACADPDQGYFPRDDLTQAALHAAADLHRGVTVEGNAFVMQAMMQAKVGTIDPDLVAAVIKLDDPSYESFARSFGSELKRYSREHNRDDTLEYVYQVADALVETTAAGGQDTHVATAFLTGFGVAPEEMAVAEQRWRRPRWDFVAAAFRAPKRLPLPPAGDQ